MPGRRVLFSEVGVMNVSLTPELEQLIHNKVESGLYVSRERSRPRSHSASSRSEIGSNDEAGKASDEIQIGIDQADREGFRRGRSVCESPPERSARIARTGRGR